MGRSLTKEGRARRGGGRASPPSSSCGQTVGLVVCCELTSKDKESRVDTRRRLQCNLAVLTRCADGLYKTADGAWSGERQARRRLRGLDSMLMSALAPGRRTFYFCPLIPEFLPENWLHKRALLFEEPWSGGKAA